MQYAQYASVLLVKFATVQDCGCSLVAPDEHSLFAALGSDTRAAGIQSDQGRAYKFAVLALHPSKEDASQHLANLKTTQLWSVKPVVQFSCILEPVRHVGSVNYLDSKNPGRIFDCGTEAVPDGNFVVITTAGFKESEGVMERMKTFSNGVLGVRISMSAADGLLSQQSFFVNGNQQVDPFTVTIWKDFKSLQSFAYGPGVHKDFLLQQKNGELADRTSFTRFRIVTSTGSWEGFQGSQLN